MDQILFVVGAFLVGFLGGFFVGRKNPNAVTNANAAAVTAVSDAVKKL